MPNEFTVVGEHKADGQWLLVLGSDGKYYSYHPRRRRLARVDLDEQWVRYADHQIVEDERYRPKKHRDQ